MKFGNSDTIHSGKASSVLPKIIKIKKELSGIVSQYPCYIFEDKKVSFALHYRKCPKNSIMILESIKDHLKKPAGINKGDTIRAINSRFVKNNFSSINICIGDDITDEYLFRANPDGVNIKVGKEKSRKAGAEYFLKGISEVQWFLEKILKRN